MRNSYCSTIFIVAELPEKFLSEQFIFVCRPSVCGKEVRGHTKRRKIFDPVRMSKKVQIYKMHKFVYAYGLLIYILKCAGGRHNIKVIINFVHFSFCSLAFCLLFFFILILSLLSMLLLTIKYFMSCLNAYILILLFRQD